jgi:hypothetical protein
MAGIEAADIQAACDAAIAGDVGPLVAMFDDDLDWRGQERGHLWWRHAPT